MAESIGIIFVLDSEMGWSNVDLLFSGYTLVPLSLVLATFSLADASAGAILAKVFFEEF